MNIIVIAFSERAKRNPLRISTDSLLALAALISVCFAPISVIYAQKSETEALNSYSTPNPGQSSLRPVEIDENLGKAPHRDGRRRFVLDAQLRDPEFSEDDTIKAEIDAIKQIRQQMNPSGLSKLFGNPQEADLQFEEELARLAINRDQDPAEGQTDNPPRQPKQVPENQLRPIEGPNCQQNEGWNTTGPLSTVRSPIRLANPFSLQPIQSNPGLRVKVSAVRVVAAQLEKSAAELENLQLYDDADTVRSAANGMWRRARSIETEEPRTSEKNASHPERSLRLNR